MGRGDQPVEEEIDYVPRARKVLSLALDEAERQGSAYVRTEHILLGMVRDGGGVGADWLRTSRSCRRTGISTACVRAATSASPVRCCFIRSSKETLQGFLR